MKLSDIMSCRYMYIKDNEKTLHKMYYCRLSGKDQLCPYQRFCVDKNEYILNKPENCKNNK